VLDGDPALPRKGAQPPHQLSAHEHCGQTAGWIYKAAWYGDRPRPRRRVRWGQATPPPPRKEGDIVPEFLTHVYSGQTVAHLSYC